MTDEIRREAGWYFIRWSDSAEWEPAQWTANNWHVLGCDPATDADMAEIDERRIERASPDTPAPAVAPLVARLRELIGWAEEQAAMRREDLQIADLTEGDRERIASDADKFADIATALLASAGAEERGWQPIDSAPRDGTKADLWAVFWNGVVGEPIGERCVNGCFKDGGWRDQWGNRLDWEDGPDDEGITSWRRVTHYMPLPAPPGALRKPTAGTEEG